MSETVYDERDMQILILFCSFFLVGVGGFFVAVPDAHAAMCPPSFSSLCNLTTDKIGSIVGVVIEVLIIIAIILALIFLILGGVKYITSGGDKGGIDAARGQLIAAIIGLVIALTAFFIINSVLHVFTGLGLNTFTIPTLIQ
jgi:hypothetical protein